jgi:hypothetical protein
LGLGLPRIGAICAVALAAACSDEGPSTPLDDLETAERLWSAVGPTSYVYAIERLCFCGESARGPVRLTVVEGTVSARTYVESGAPVEGIAADWFPEVEGLFGVVREALSEGAATVRVTYDPVNGVPVDIWIDYSETIIDEELGFIVTEAVTQTS